MTDRDVRRETADEIASALEDRADRATAASKGLTGEQFWACVGLARGLKLAADRAAQIGRKEPT